MRFLSSIVTMLLSIAIVVGPSLAQSSGEPVSLAVIAHGVTPRPDGEVAWRVRPRRAPLPERGRGIARPASFVLAEGGSVAIVALSGKVQSRLSPGEAVWMPPGLPAAVVSLDDLPVGYAQIELAPVSDLSAAEWELATDPFALPLADDAVDLKLVRGVVRLRDAIDAHAGIAPGLLYVTSGIVGVKVGSDVRVQLTAGAVLEVEGEVKIFGGSRQPATFVLASVAAAVQDTVPLLNGAQPTVAPVATGMATVISMPAATPRSRPTIAPIPPATGTPPTPMPMATTEPEGEATVVLSAAICPVAYGGSDYELNCVSPASDVEFTLSAGEVAIRSEIADAAGEVSFAALPAGDSVIAAGVPGDFASSRVQCLDATGVDIARRAAANQIVVSLVPDDAISCAWFIVPDDARGEIEAPALTIEILACAHGVVPVPGEEGCTTTLTGTQLSLELDGEVSAPARTSDDSWRWENLDAGAYALNVREWPEGFIGAQLDDIPCCGDLGDFTIDIRDDVASGDDGITHRLYLLAGPDVSPTPEPQEAIGSISVHVRACPVEMTVETLALDACVPAPAGTSLSLLADDVPQGVFDVGPELWWWRNIPLRAFSLVVNALPRGFASSSLGSRVCCDSGDGYEVYTSAETPDTGYFLFLYPTSGVEPQANEATVAITATPEAPLDPLLAVDPDGDGVPTTDEDGFFGTDPEQIDTDGDGVTDTVEIAAGANPLVADVP